MKRKDIKNMSVFFDRYILKVKENTSLIDGLESSLDDFISYDFDALEKLKDNVYAPGKWTIKDIIQHINDNERIQSTRAMRFSRNDQTELSGYDENQLASFANTSNITLEDLKQEFIALRRSTIFLFKNMDQKMLEKEGIASDISISVASLGFVLIGHQKHHFSVIEERYLPLL